MLTNTDVEAARPRERAFKLGDAKGLYLFVMPTGSRSWRLKYRFAGKERRLTFGRYPEVGLPRARELRDQARVLLNAGQDPRTALEVAAQRDAAALIAEYPDAAPEACVYFVRADDGLIKIGVTKDMRKRLAQLQLAFQAPLELLGTLTGGYATEGMLHRLFTESSVSGEWFRPSPRLLEFIEENASVA